MDKMKYKTDRHWTAIHTYEVIASSYEEASSLADEYDMNGNSVDDRVEFIDTRWVKSLAQPVPTRIDKDPIEERVDYVVNRIMNNITEDEFLGMARDLFEDFFTNDINTLSEYEEELKDARYDTDWN